RLVEVLRTGEVEIERARAPFAANGTSHPAGTLVVRMQQPASGFAKALLERQRYPDLREYAGGPPKPPYDVTAHTLPLLLGVDALAVASPFDAALEPLGERPLEPGRIEGRGPRLALAHSSGELVALGRLLAAGVEARWTLEPFAEGGRSFPAGTLLIKGSARGRVEPLAAELGFVARAVRSEPRSLRLRTPRVGLYRSWVSSMDEGWTRYVFEKEMAVPYQTLLDTDVRAGGLAERFDAIVLPDQSVTGLRDGHVKGVMPDEYTGGLGAEGGRALKAFVEGGGTLVALDSATAYAIEALGLKVKDALAGVTAKDFYCPGSILGASVDTRRPLAHGLPETLPVWFEGSPAFEAEAGVLARYESSDPLLSGWLLGGERLRGKASLVEAALGKGRVVLFGFRPQYRAQSRVSYVALLNALYLSAARP
ncbi:MAG: peptidase M14, partial [Vicinamibacterales bacterium]